MKPLPLPPLLFRQIVLLALVAGIAAHWWPAAWVLLPLFFCFDSRSREPLRVLLVLAAALAGFAYAGWRDGVLPEMRGWDGRKGRTEITGAVVESRGLPGGQQRVILEDVTQAGQALPGRLAWTWDAPLWRPVSGERVSAALRVLPAVGFRNAGRDAGDWARQGIFWRAYSFADKGNPRVVQSGSALATLREAWRVRLVEELERLRPTPPPPPGQYGQSAPSPPGGWGMLPALLFGDRSYLGVDEVERLTRAGLVHSIALSGQHLAVMGVFAFSFLWLAGAFWPRIWLRIPRNRAVMPLSLFFASGYLWLGSAPPSLWRAFLMLAFWALFFWRKRPAAFPDAMLAALVCMAVASPACLTNIGVQLSFASVAGIALLSPTLAALWRGAFAGKVPASPCRRILFAVGRFMVSLLACSLAVQAATLPLSLYIFGRISPWFLLNLLWLPILGFFVLPLAFLGLFCLITGFKTGASLFLLGAMEPCRILLAGLASLDQANLLNSLWLPRPHWTMGLGWSLLIVTFAFSLFRPFPPPAKWRRIAAAGIVLCLCGPALWYLRAFADTVTLRVLDVGQGQAVLLELPGNRRVLVDGGGFTSDRFDSGRDIVAPVLADNAPLRLDLVAVTHPDVDHLGGLSFLARTFRIGAALLPGKDFSPDGEMRKRTFMNELALRHVPAREVRAGDCVDLGEGLALEVLAPLPGGRKSDNDGLILRLTRNGRGLVLIPGDAGSALLNRLARAPGDLRADVLVAPHHGSAGSVSLEFIRRVAPREVLVSCGLGNTFAFPSEKLRQLLRNENIPWRSTAREGELQVRW